MISAVEAVTFYRWNRRYFHKKKQSRNYHFAYMEWNLGSNHACYKMKFRVLKSVERLSISKCRQLYQTGSISARHYSAQKGKVGHFTLETPEKNFKKNITFKLRGGRRLDTICFVVPIIFHGFVYHSLAHVFALFPASLLCAIWRTTDGFLQSKT